MVRFHLLELSTVGVMHEVQPVGPGSSVTQNLISSVVLKDQVEILQLTIIYRRRGVQVSLVLFFVS